MKPPFFLVIFLLSLNHVIASQQNIENIRNWLSGKFNNLKQVEENIAKNRTTPADGGHESIYTIFNRHSFENDVMVASYYLQNVSKPFRYRYYKCILPIENNGDSLSSRFCCIMKIYKPSKAANEKLMTTSYSTTESLPPLEEFEIISGTASSK